MPVSVLVRIKRPDALAEFQDRLGQGKFAEGIAAARFDGLDARLDERMVRHGERQPRDDDVGQRLARHIHALPETVRAEQHRVHVVLEFFQHRRARRAGALHETCDAQLVEKRLHRARATSCISLKLVNSTNALPCVIVDEMLDPMNQRVAITGLARVGHFFGDEQFHLPLVIERRADLQLRRGFRADALDEIIQRRNARLAVGLRTREAAVFRRLRGAPNSWPASRWS